MSIASPIRNLNKDVAVDQLARDVAMKGVGDAAEARTKAEAAETLATEAKSKADSADQRVAGVEGSVTQAASDAATALTTASSAETTAAAADTKADQAISDAAQASTAAATADTKAQQGINDAAAAASTASTAVTTANNAQSGVTALDNLKVTAEEHNVAETATAYRLTKTLTTPGGDVNVQFSVPHKNGKLVTGEDYTIADTAEGWVITKTLSLADGTSIEKDLPAIPVGQGAAGSAFAANVLNPTRTGSTGADSQQITVYDATGANTISPVAVSISDPALIGTAFLGGTPQGAASVAIRLCRLSGALSRTSGTVQFWLVDPATGDIRFESGDITVDASTEYLAVWEDIFEGATVGAQVFEVHAHGTMSNTGTAYAADPVAVRAAVMPGFSASIPLVYGAAAPSTAHAMTAPGGPPGGLTDMALWLDASDASTITASGGAVSEWRDKSGKGNHFTQATAANQPSTGLANIGGVNAIDFNEANEQYLTLGSHTLADTDLFADNGDASTAYTIIQVARIDAVNGALFGRIKGGNGSMAGFVTWNDNLEQFISEGKVMLTDATRPWVGQAAVYAQTWDGSDYAFECPFGTSNRSGNLGPNDTSIHMQIGASSDLNAALFFDGAVAEVLVFARALTAQELAAVTADLNAKYGL